MYMRQHARNVRAWMRNVEIVGECLHDCLRTRKRSYAIRFYAENEDIKCIIVSAKYKVYYSRSFANSPAIISRARTKIRVEMREDSLRCTSNRVKRDYSAFCFLPLPRALFHLCYLSWHLHLHCGIRCSTFSERCKFCHAFGIIETMRHMQNF